MDKNQRIQSARETLSYYDSYPKEKLKQTSKIYIGELAEAATKADYTAEYAVYEENVLQRIFFETPHGKTGVLNFASAIHPGGGFQSGAAAQEETLARCSFLYPELLKFTDEYYKYNQEHINRHLYSSRLIYSKDVLFIKNDIDGQELMVPPVLCDVVTLPAPNKSANICNDPKVTDGEYEEDLQRKIIKILRAFKENHCEILILGAFGCGVFGNEPFQVARLFQQALSAKEFQQAFKKVCFSILGNDDNLRAFQLAFPE
ncbi:TIGR02452 family protein [Vagococcus elongatus]|uniref:TIGR02452 family protein n=1 Tax=Vagococcus elongatus TaxID=180344 RepID=A0A430B5T9_9ENTE|nr:TIGR02452 family protein [Vagococcus elongatus]RSU15673.1 TIGR02452 family protein [Vagococcus elongatus]